MRPGKTLGLLSILLNHALLSTAVTPTSFCKCICGMNSTIIPLDGTPLDPAESSLSRPNPDSAPDTLIPSEGIIDGPIDPDGSLDAANAAFEGSGLDADETMYYRRMAARSSIKAKREDPPTPGVAPVGEGFSSLVDEETEEPEENHGNSTDTQLVTPKRSGTCNDCNRQFCLDHPDFDKMCGEAKEEEVFTTCFQRDSTKDQLVVYTFIIVTVSLLAYTAIRPWVQKRIDSFAERRSYAPVDTQG